MNNIFYVLTTESGLYNLCVRGTHYCLSSSPDKEVILRVLRTYVLRHKSADGLYEALKGLSDKGIVPSTTFSRRKNLFESGHTVLDDEVEDIVYSASKEVKDILTHKNVRKPKLVKRVVEEVVHTTQVQENMRKPKVLKKKVSLLKLS